MRAILKRWLAKLASGGEPATTPSAEHSEPGPLPPADARIDSARWAQLHATPIKKVSRLSSRVAAEIEKLTSPGDLLLETGCGSAAISAELATVGRRIALCDFSREILDRAADLFVASRLPAPEMTLCDLNQPLPWSDGAVDTAWSAGVLEHWTDEELGPMIKEMARISRKSVIALVPNARSLFYRFGKHLAEKRGTWLWGLELPRISLRHVFEAAGLKDVREFTLNVDQACGFLAFFEPALFDEATSWLQTVAEDDPVLANQGYLLLTVGYKTARDCGAA